MFRALASLVCGVGSIVVSFVPIAGIFFGVIAIGAGGPLKEDRRAVIGMLTGLVGIVLSAVIAASSLETVIA